MTDSENAKMLLKNYTFVAVKGDVVYTSQKRGIAPLMDFFTAGIDLDGFSVADKIIGKASAMLLYKLGACNIYGEVLSKPAFDFLKDKNVVLTYKNFTEMIINRRGDGMCPMECAVLNIEDCEEAYSTLLNKLSDN